MVKNPKPVAVLFPILLLWPVGAAARNLASAEAIDIKVTPERLVLGESTEARVTVRVPTTSRRACGTLRIHANTGEITDVVKEREGEFTAAYRLPTDYFPRFALVAAATVCSGVKVSGIAVVELFGAGTVEVKSKPFSMVTLKIAKDTFGPVLTNAKGKALVPIVVAPGIRTGVVGDKLIDLNLPPVNRIVAVADRVRVKAGEGENASVIRIYAIDELGYPLSKADFETRVLKGTLSNVERLSPGLYRAAYTSPEKIGDSVDEVTVGLKGDAVSVDTIAIELFPGAPARIGIDATPKQYTAGSGLPIEVTATVLDRFGNTTEADIVAKTDIGTLTGPTATAPGDFRMQLKLSDRFEGKRTAGITVSLKQTPGIKAGTEVSLKAASPAAIEIEAVKGSVPADGITPHRIPATIRAPTLFPLPPPSVKARGSRKFESPRIT
jgi:hypothetical protein